MEIDNQQLDVIYIGFLRTFGPVLLHLANRPGHATTNPQVQTILERILYNAHTPTPDEITIVRTWAESENTMNAMDHLDGPMIEEIMNAYRNRPIETVYTEPILLSRPKRNRTCGIMMEPIRPNTHHIDFLDNNTYSIHAFKTYYDLEKEKKRNNPDYQMITPIRVPITPAMESYIDQFYARLGEPRAITRSTNKKRRQSPPSGGGKKSHRKKSCRIRKIRKTFRRQYTRTRVL